MLQLVVLAGHPHLGLSRMRPLLLDNHKGLPQLGEVKGLPEIVCVTFKQETRRQTCFELV